MRNAAIIHAWLGSLCAVAALACSAPTALDEDGELGVSVAALSVCEEMVPTNRYIDGIPAYAQCAGSMSAAIYSNDGINTSTTKMGADWVRTQYSGGYQCTELAHRYLYFRWDIDWVPRGNAGSWCDAPPPADIGIVQTMEPVHGDVMVLAPGSCGASSSTGHATVVDVVNGESLSVVEQNGARRGTYKKTCAKCFLHVMVNDGMPSDIDPPGMPDPGTPTAGSAAPPTMPPPTVPPPPVTMPPPSTPATPPATPGTPAPGVPMAGSSAPAPSTPVPVPAPAPTAAPAPVTAPLIPTMPVQTPPPRSTDPSAEAGCAVARVRGAGHGSSTDVSWLGFALGLAALAARRRRRDRRAA